MSNPTERGYRKIWAEFARFNMIRQRFADPAGMILKNTWFSDLKILEICEHVNVT